MIVPAPVTETVAAYAVTPLYVPPVSETDVWEAALAACVTSICWPSTVMCAVRAAPAFAVNEK